MDGKGYNYGKYLRTHLHGEITEYHSHTVSHPLDIILFLIPPVTTNSSQLQRAGLSRGQFITTQIAAHGSFILSGSIHSSLFESAVVIQTVARCWMLFDSSEATR